MHVSENNQRRLSKIAKELIPQVKISVDSNLTRESELYKQSLELNAFNDESQSLRQMIKDLYMLSIYNRRTLREEIIAEISDDKTKINEGYLQAILLAIDGD